MTSSLKELNTVAEYDALIQSTDKVVLLDFYADWCGPCRMQTPTVEEFNRKHGDKVEVRKVNVDVNQDLAAKYNIFSIPTLIAIKDGKVIGMGRGYQDLSKLEKLTNTAPPPAASRPAPIKPDGGLKPQ